MIQSLVNQELIDALKQLTEMAESGKLTSLVAVGITNKASVVDCVSLSPYANEYAIIGGLRVLERNIMDTCCQLREGDFISG